MTVVQLAKSEPVPELVDLLREMLAEAESGELVGLCLVAEYRGHDPWTFSAPSMVAEVNLCLDQLKQELVVGEDD